MPKPDGSIADLSVIRPLWWLQGTGAAVGGSIEIGLHEIGLSGEATVLAIGPCDVDSRETRLGMSIVTGTIRHRNATVWDLTFDDRTEETLGVTANHPLYSETRHAWIPAGDLRLDEVVRTLNGHSTLTARTQRPTRETVFKLEDWVVKNTALGKFFSEGMAQFYGSWKVWPSIHKDWDYVKKTDGLTRTGLIIQIIGVSYAEWRIYLGIAELMDEE